ncbi:MAG: hypothetical protein II889_10610 [Clostridia bacterium]|nr:hypothetical protein [Clostridia bacterium]
MSVKAGANIAFMMNFVCDFIDERMDRDSFDLDFHHHLIERYDGMFRENAEAAQAFAESIGDVVDRSSAMSDDDFRDALCDPYDLVLDILRGRAY